MSIHRAAIVGAGPAGLIAYVALRYRGMRAEDIVVLDAEGAPLAGWERYTSAIAQRAMRSESEGHFFATDFPGFALLDALHQASSLPLLRSAVNRYHPSLSAVIDHGRALADHYQMQQSLERAQVGRVERVQEPEPHFRLYDERGGLLLRAHHVLLALGHGSWRWPEVCADPTERAVLGSRLCHAYQPKQYGPQKVLVVGSGMGAVGEWVNVLRHGGRVVALHRSPHLVEQPLSAPRCAFGGPWLDRYHTLDADERVAILADLARGNAPRPPEWRRVLRTGEREGRLQMQVGELSGLVPQRDGGVIAEVRCGDGGGLSLSADMVIAATGFAYGWQEHAVLRALAAEYGVETRGRHLVLADDCTIPGISSADAAISLSGPLARWAFPPADSFAGMKYAARRFAERVHGRSSGVRLLGSWWHMVRGGRPYAAGGRRNKACATQ